MAPGGPTMTLRLTELEDVRLFLWELRQLESDMRVGASPYAERLTAALDRLMERTDVTKDQETDE